MKQNMTCLLLEDDHFTMTMMKDIIVGAYPQVKIISCYQIAEAEQYLVSTKVDFCILDINLPDGNSFDWLSRISCEITYSFRIIFITAYSTYAAKAFRFNALDFVVKPFSPADLYMAIDRVLQSINDEFRKLELEQALRNLSHSEEAEQRLVLKSQKAIHIVRLGEILYLSADNNYCNFHLTDGRILLVSQPLKHYHDKLNGFGFLRIHQSYLVNQVYITSLKKKTNQLIMSNKESLPVAQSRRVDVIAYLGQL
ncbi:LytR/AlgR family response regulator transcription factor [Sphingobacterium corticibacterium]|uniref:Response regulator transcription factor n=1 Tax=Sphingobacterium corticibacterium TaxID=2484746 RepID=A0A4Q6XYT8_9SPHI|nr:LytTR family DNA-binding domain-containing protein [Sphingobacterium corticibacterium]RZF62129.1 response regulator transcription factor [Sphingobacterium corticibacterium]